MENGKLIIHPKRPKGDDGHKTFSIRVKEELVEQLDAIAAQTGHSRNELICTFLEYALNHYTISETQS